MKVDISLEVTKLEHQILEAVKLLTGDVLHAATTSILHLSRAYRLLEEMPDLAVFLAITAEEESATAVFKLLKRMGYRDAKKLKPKSHLHKAALHTFTQWMAVELRQKDQAPPHDFIFSTENSKDGKTSQLRLRFKLELKGLDEPIAALPHPPLGFTYKGPNGEPIDYPKRIREIALDKGISDIHSKFVSLSNLRNKLLYASPTSPPGVNGAEHALKIYRTATMQNLMLILLIEPYDIQELVQEAIYTFIKVVSRVEPRIDGCSDNAC